MSRLETNNPMRRIGQSTSSDISICIYESADFGIVITGL